MNHDEVLSALFDLAKTDTSLPDGLKTLEKRILAEVDTHNVIGVPEICSLFNHARNSTDVLLQDAIQSRGRYGTIRYDSRIVREKYVAFMLAIPVQRYATFVEEQELKSAQQAWRLVRAKKKKNLFGRDSIPAETVIDQFRMFLQEQQDRQKYTTCDVAEIMDVREFTVRSWIAAGAVKTVKWHNQHYLSAEEFSRVTSYWTLRDLATACALPVRAVRAAQENGSIGHTYFMKSVVIPPEEVSRIMSAIDAGTIFQLAKRKQARHALNAYAEGLPDAHFANAQFGLEAQRELTLLAAKRNIPAAVDAILNDLAPKAQYRAGYARKFLGVPFAEALHYAHLGILTAIQNVPSLEHDFTGFACVHMRWSIFKLHHQERPHTIVPYDDSKSYPSLE